MAIITGTDGDDKYPYGTELRGTNLADQIYGLAGDDALVGFDGNDLLEGGAGADELYGEYGFDLAGYQGSPAGVTVYMSSSYGAEGGDPRPVPPGERKAAVPGSRRTIADVVHQQQRWIGEQSRWWTSVRLPRSDADPQETEAEARQAGLTEIADFGSNPGALRMLVDLPEDLPSDAPLVVVLHGCTQRAVAFDRACGWSDLAARLGFALLLPEQRRANNPKRCFNWFTAGDTRRDAGEALSIRQMVDRMVAGSALDPGRVYVEGLSAGGAMAAAVVAAYPELFAGGAVIGGVPYGAATNPARPARPWPGGWTVVPPGAGATPCAPLRPTAGRGPGSRSGTATPTHPCTRSTPSGSRSSGPNSTVSPASLCWRSGTAPTCVASGAGPTARRWWKATPSPAWGTARPSARARVLTAAASPARPPSTSASPLPTASSRSGAWRRSPTRPLPLPLLVPRSLMTQSG